MMKFAAQPALLPATEAASLQELTGCRQTLATIRHLPASPRQPNDQESAAVLISTGALFQSNLVASFRDYCHRNVFTHSLFQLHASGSDMWKTIQDFSAVGKWNGHWLDCRQV
ncbi:MAG: hypothetical protein WKF77_04620 [Planctomycetaceae bacterium]